MSNMSYCRFRNTLAAMRDCHDHMDDDCVAAESAAREQLIELCKQIVEEQQREPE